MIGVVGVDGMIGTRMHKRCMAVLRVLQSEGPLKRSVIGERIGITSGYLSDILAMLHYEGKVSPDGKGIWRVREANHASSRAGETPSS